MRLEIERRKPDLLFEAEFCEVSEISQKASFPL